ncbi:restriction endonuclease subunit S [Mycoplasma bovis]|nr:restriction endonuclease subunit S [Mycoplasmopsis bovis]UJB25138.1 restriction endonuclease subunit S [Mycoplasmopsis bovis]
MHNGIFTDLDFDNIVVSNAFFTIDVDESIADPHFIYYYLTDRRQISKMQILAESSTTYPTLSLENIENFEIELPNINAQAHIGKLLSSIDKKINLNNKINDNLLKQAKHIYLHYFFNKKPNGFLNDLIKEFEKSKIFVKDAKGKKGKYPFYTSGDSILEFDRFLVDGRYCFLNTGGNADIKFYAGKASYSSDTWCIYSEHKMTDYLYLLLHTAKEEINTKYFEGTSLKHLQKELLKKKAIYIPTEIEISNFNRKIVPVLSAISANNSENWALTNYKNTLLPLLMNGQVTIED